MRLRDAHKERVIGIKMGSDICENVGLALVDYMSLEPGRYRLYYMRIQNEVRGLHLGRLAVLG